MKLTWEKPEKKILNFRRSSTLSVHFYRDEEEKEEERQEKQEKEKKLHSRDRKTGNVRPSYQYSENEQDISKKSTEKPTKTKPDVKERKL